MKIFAAFRRARFCAGCGEPFPETARPLVRAWCRPCRSIGGSAVRPLVLGGVALAGLGGVGLGRVTSPHDPPEAPAPEVRGALAPGASGAPATGAAAPEAPAVALEPLAPCGARTKKGTRCKHMVRGGVRCWQHGGPRGGGASGDGKREAPATARPAS